ncbi:hypothetical protein V6N11_038057 [Hibiscus sabdariffa]|uniref:RNase H type-1 domain-containing protein n=1 Tax=Hibiscus sabdariffa TaxID=183260 RepID=A0ABR1ZXG0_9ROSI
MVADMVDNSGRWDWNRLSQWLPNEALERIVAVKPLQNGAGDDNPGWRWEKNQNCSTKSAYKALENDISADRNHVLSKIWKLPIPQRVRVCIWLVAHQRILTNMESRVMQEPKLVKYGNQIVEDFISTNYNRIRPKVNHLASWCLPANGWMKANCEGAVNPNDGSAAIGGVIRNEQGMWQIGFSRSIGHCTSLAVELWATHDILNHAWQLGYRKIELETDNLEVVKIITRSSNILANTLLVDDILELISRPCNENIQHIHRCKNVVADKLAALSWGKPMGEMVFDSPPLEVLNEVQQDMLRCGYC